MRGVVDCVCDVLLYVALHHCIAVHWVAYCCVFCAVRVRTWRDGTASNTLCVVY